MTATTHFPVVHLLVYRVELIRVNTRTTSLSEIGSILLVVWNVHWVIRTSTFVVQCIVHLVIICSSISKPDALIEWYIIKSIYLFVIGLHIRQVVVAATMVRHLLNIVVLLFLVPWVHSSIHLVIIMMPGWEILHHGLLILHSPRHLVPVKVFNYNRVAPIIPTFTLLMSHL